MTSTFTLTRVDLFPNGSSVGAYPVTNWTKAERDAPSGAPAGSATNSQTMTSSTLTFTGLADNTSYWAVGPSPYNYIRFKTSATAGPFLPSAPGTSGQVLTMSSSGYAAWADASAGTPATGSITSGMILDGTIVDADINASAAIAGTKIATGGITTTQIADGTITTTDISATAGITSAQIADATIVNADISTTAAIASSKVSGTATINTQSGTSYTAVLTDAGPTLVTMSNASASTFTVPPNASVAFAIGDWLDVIQLGAGQVTLTPGAAVTLSERESKLKMSGQYARVTLLKVATNQWVVSGDVST